MTEYEFKLLLNDLNNAIQGTFTEALNNRPVLVYTHANAAFGLFGQLKHEMGMFTSPGNVDISGMHLPVFEDSASPETTRNEAK